jgi:hypothetical protein
MSRFDLAGERERARISLSLEQNDRRENHLPRSVGHAATLALDAAVKGWIIGLQDEAHPVAHRAREWLEDSVARGEDFGDPPEYFALQRARALAVACWMDGVSAEQWFRETFRLHAKRFETRQDELPDYLRDCFSAGVHAAGVVAYERHVGPAPMRAQDVHTPLELAAWLCAAERRVPPADWTACGERVLREQLADWLRHGQGVEAAAWLKVAFADSGAASGPGEAFRRARELLEHDCPAAVADVMLESLGDPIDVDLFAGFLAAVGSAMSGADDPAYLVATFDDRFPLIVPIAPADITGGLDEAVRAAIEAEPASLPELLESITNAARRRIVNSDGERLALRDITAHGPEAVEENLADDDWRDRMAGLVMVGRLRLAELAPLVVEAEIPPSSVGLREADRRALLALRDMAAARALGRPFERPVHPDPAVAAGRAALLNDLAAVLDGTGLPGPDSPAYVVRAILEPDAVRGGAHPPMEWRRWL